MDTQWNMTQEERRIADFTDNLADEINKDLTEKEGHTKVTTHALDKNSGFIIGLNYNDKHYMEVMVSKSRKEKFKLTIDRFWGIQPAGISTVGRSSFPYELRNAAQIYDEITCILDKKFGKPISENNGRSIYRANLEETISV